MFKPNLAGKPNSDDDIRFPVLASPKIDGVRAMVHEHFTPQMTKPILMSRSMKPIPNDYVQAVLAIPELHGLDGELVVGSPTDPNCMQNTTSGVMAKGKIPEFQFHVFDNFLHRGGFDERLREASRAVAAVQSRWTQIAVSHRLDGLPMITCPLVMVPHVLIDNLDMLNTYEAMMLAEGWEGVMVRDPAGVYKQGRSTPKEGGLLKIKRFTDAEAIIVGFEEEMKNNNVATTNELGRTKRSSHKDGKAGKDTLGAFICKRLSIDTKGNLVESDYTFNIGTGMSADFRAIVWANRPSYMGKIVKFKHFDHGVVDAPRHPVFLGFRDIRDLS